MSLHIKDGILRRYSPKQGVTEVVIPAGVTAIADCAFEMRRELQKITIPDGVTRIGNCAFFNAESLTRLDIPESVTEIGTAAFAWCKNLTEINIPAGVTVISESAFAGCESLKAVSIPAGVTVIGESAFAGCANLPEISIPAGVTSIGNSAFAGCANLPEISIPEGVTSIGNSAFAGCRKLKAVSIPESVHHIGTEAFSDTPWLTRQQAEKKPVIVNGILIDGKQCEGAVVIPPGVTAILSNAFSHCTALTELDIPESVTDIGYHAFFKTKWLAKKQKENPLVIVNGILTDGFRCAGAVVIPESVTVIGENAFRNCKKLTEITIPASVKSIGAGAFHNCPALCIIRLHPDDPVLRRDYAKVQNLSGNLDTAWKMLHTGDYNQRMSLTVKYPVLLLHYLRTKDETLGAFIRKNITKIIRAAVSAGDLEMIETAAKAGDFINRRGIDLYILQAQNEQQYAIAAFLMDYKNRHFGFARKDDGLL